MMLTRRAMLAATAQFGLAAMALSVLPARALAAQSKSLQLSDAEWQKKLTPEQYSVLRHEGTERPFTSPLLNEHRRGTFSCAGCDLELFSSKTKFESGTGWPSFWAPLDNAVTTKSDSTLGMVRTAVMCSRCDGHLGHVFDDGPAPTGLRYCMNGVALAFKPAVA